MRNAARLAPAIAFIAITLAARAALAQGAGRSLDIDVSIRASGMGQASNAVFWGDELNQWSNPALLGYARGLRYEWGKTRLVPGLAADVFFKSNVVKLGGGGLGVSLSGKPLHGFGSVRLSYGESVETDQNGNPIGTFESFEKVDSWGFGLSLAQAFETVATLAGHNPPLVSRFADVSVGMNAKKLGMHLGSNVDGSTTTVDRGLLVRISPLGALPASLDLPLSLDLAYGWSELSHDDATLSLPTLGSVPLSRHERHGYAGRAALKIPVELLERARHHRGGWLLEGFDPLLSFGYADDRDRIEPSNGDFKTHGHGSEVTAANVFFYRRGHYSDPLGDIEGDTEGWGVGLPVGRFGGLRYDHATIPQATLSGLPDVKRDAVSGWIDPLELWRVWHAAHASI